MVSLFSMMADWNFAYVIIAWSQMAITPRPAFPESTRNSAAQTPAYHSDLNGFAFLHDGGLELRLCYHRVVPNGDNAAPCVPRKYSQFGRANTGIPFRSEWFRFSP